MQFQLELEKEKKYLLSKNELFSSRQIHQET